MKLTRRIWISSFALTTLLQASCREGKTPEATPQKPVPDGDGKPNKGEEPDSDQAFVGLTEEAGAALATSRGLKYRTVAIDGRLLPTTRDYRVDRINFEIVEGRIARVSRG